MKVLCRTNEDGVAILAINRPHRRNAMNLAMTRALARELENCATDDAVRAIVLRGEQHGFCAGSDLKDLADLSIQNMIRDEREMGALARAFNWNPKPIVAAVDGYAVGGGMILAASCDLVLSSRTAHWVLPEVAIGWNAAWGISALRARLGIVRARHVLWGVDSFDGGQAHRIGLCDFLVEEDAATAALTYAKRLAKLPAHAVMATKSLFTGDVGRDAVELDDLAMAAFEHCLIADSAQETLRKFGMKVS